MSPHLNFVFYSLIPATLAPATSFLTFGTALASAAARISGVTGRLRTMSKVPVLYLRIVECKTVRWRNKRRYRTANRSWRQKTHFMPPLTLS